MSTEHKILVAILLVAFIIVTLKTLDYYGGKIQSRNVRRKLRKKDKKDKK